MTYIVTEVNHLSDVHKRFRKKHAARLHAEDLARKKCKYASRDKAAHAIKTRKYDQMERVRSLMLLGGKCERCQFNDMRALQIDHIAGGGTKHHKQVQAMGVVRDVMRNPDRYQLLCANHNWIKRWERGENKRRIYN